MKKYLLLLILASLPLCGNNKIFYDDLIQKKAPQELGRIHVIEKRDVIDKNNLEAFEKYNPGIIIKDDFNNNGKEDLVIPCVSESKSKTWYVLFFEKSNGEYNFIQYFKFNFKSMYIFKIKGKKGYVITLGESFASDAYYNIFWNGKKYIQD